MDSFFTDHGGYLYHIDLQQTMDAHSRRIVVDNVCIGTVLFHKWKFLFDFEPAHSVNAKVFLQVIKAIDADTSIRHQRLEDERQTMTQNARAGLAERNIDTTGLSDREAVELYLKQPA